jgi:hypothetical protein
MMTFQITAKTTGKEPESWPFPVITFTIRARDEEWAKGIAEETIGLIEIQRGAYNSMQVQEIAQVAGI